MNIWRVLREPAAGITAAAGGAAAAEVGVQEMTGEVLARLGLPAELAGEGKAPTSNIQAPVNNQAPNPKAEEGAPSGGAPGAPAGGAPEETPEETAAREEAEAAAAANETPEEKAERERLEAEAAAGAKGWEAEKVEMEGKLTAAQERLATLEKDLGLAKAKPVAVSNLHPLIMAADGHLEKVDEAEGKIVEFEKWALENWNGTKNAEGEVEYTGEQIRKRYADLKELREKTIPVARAVAGQIAEGEKAARVAYPELFDPKRGEAGLREAILKVAPGIRAQFPNFDLIFGDALVGEKLRLAKAPSGGARPAKAGTPSGTPAGEAPGAAAGAPAMPGRAVKKLPPVPKGGPGVLADGHRAGGAGGRKGTQEGPTAKRFMELGGNRDALVAMLEETELPTAAEKGTG